MEHDYSLNAARGARGSSIGPDGRTILQEEEKFIPGMNYGTNST